MITIETNTRLQYELTMISAMTRGCRKGRRRRAKKRVTTRTKQIWTINKGREKFMGLSPCQTPLETADIGFVHIFDDTVPLLFKAEEVDISRMHICRRGQQYFADIGPLNIWL